jgi:hypothetical protein
MGRNRFAVNIKCWFDFRDVPKQFADLISGQFLRAGEGLRDGLFVLDKGANRK